MGDVLNKIPEQLKNSWYMYFFQVRIRSIPAYKKNRETYINDIAIVAYYPRVLDAKRELGSY
jgi:hypothetical protein